MHKPRCVPCRITDKISTYVKVLVLACFKVGLRLCHQLSFVSISSFPILLLEMQCPVSLDDIVSSRWPSPSRVGQQQVAVDANITVGVISFALHEARLDCE
jgi:hypothetical protein